MDHLTPNPRHERPPRRSGSSGIVGVVSGRRRSLSTSITPLLCGRRVDRSTRNGQNVFYDGHAERRALGLSSSHQTLWFRLKHFGCACLSALRPGDHPTGDFGTRSAVEHCNGSYPARPEQRLPVGSVGLFALDCRTTSSMEEDSI